MNRARDIAWWFALLAALLLLGLTLPSPDRSLDDLEVTPVTAGEPVRWGEDGP